MSSLDEEANELACDMYRAQVGRVIQDPDTAEALMPRDYPMGCKRPVIDTHYYETFNRDNVTLVDLRRGGIESHTVTGVSTAQGDYAFDVLVYATGFDAMTGALGKIDIRGRATMRSDGILGGRAAHLSWACRWRAFQTSLPSPGRVRRQC
jgi:cyclohexanone monooxygenase